MDIKNMSLKELEALCENIRKKLIDVVSKNGGHLSSNLGVVELTTALHYTFDSPKDAILWDVGHQSYVHKMLTDRYEKIDTIRLKGGLSPFSNPKESIHDHFVSGHAGNILSAAYGIAEADKESKVVAVVGDAAFSNGQSLEAINSIGGNSKNVIVVLNDNEMSIGENVGALFKYMSRVMSTQTYNNLKEDVEGIIRKLSFGNKIADTIKRFEHSVRYFIYPGTLFEELGFTYVGPVDGHNLNELITVFKDIQKIKGPVLVHVKTIKGKGYQHAEKDTEKFHGISPFNIKTGEICSSTGNYSKIFGSKMVKMAENDNGIIAICAGMIKGTGLNEFFHKFHERAYDVGIAEENAVTFAGGLAVKGKKPVVAIYSTFLQRGYDQMIHDIALQNLKVTFVLDRAGIVGEDGATHNGVFDLSYLTNIPNFTVIAPTTINELEKSLEYGINKSNGPVAIRIPKNGCFECEKVSEFVFGKWNEIKKGKKTLIIACGSMLKEIMDVENELNNYNIFPTIVSAAFVKPFDEEYILKNISLYDNIFVLEENVLKGGFGSSIIEFLNDKKILKNVIRLGIPDRFIEHGKREDIMEELGLKGKKLISFIVEGGK